MYNVYVETLSNLAAAVQCVFVHKVCYDSTKDFIMHVKKDKRLETLPPVHILTQ